MLFCTNSDKDIFDIFLLQLSWTVIFHSSRGLKDGLKTVIPKALKYESLHFLLKDWLKLIIFKFLNFSSTPTCSDHSPEVLGRPGEHHVHGRLHLSWAFSQTFSRKSKREVGPLESNLKPVLHNVLGENIKKVIYLGRYGTEYIF